MIRECFACETGILFDSKILHEKIGLNTASLYPVFISRNPKDRIAPSGNLRIKSREDERIVTANDDYGQLSEEYEDLHDALSAKYDQLEMKKHWWILEWLPLSHQVQDSDSKHSNVPSKDTYRS